MLKSRNQFDATTSICVLNDSSLMLHKSVRSCILHFIAESIINSRLVAWRKVDDVEAKLLREGKLATLD